MLQDIEQITGNVSIDESNLIMPEDCEVYEILVSGVEYLAEKIRCLRNVTVENREPKKTVANLNNEINVLKDEKYYWQKKFVRRQRLIRELLVS